MNNTANPSLIPEERKGGFHPPFEPPEQGRLPCTCTEPIFILALCCLCDGYR